jgi:hypothetical protein
VRVASTVSPSFFLSAPEMAPRMVWCCQPVRQHRLVRGGAEILADVVLYLAAMLVVIVILGQLRLAPSGHVTGIYIDAALKIGAARGSDLAVLSELLPAAETALVEGLCGDRVRDDGP